MAKRMTKAQFSIWLDKLIDRDYSGNKSEAARAWDENVSNVYEVIGLRRNPTSKILESVGYKKTTSTFYVEDKDNE